MIVSHCLLPQRKSIMKPKLNIIDTSETGDYVTMSWFTSNSEANASKLLEICPWNCMWCLWQVQIFNHSIVYYTLILVHVIIRKHIFQDLQVILKHSGFLKSFWFRITSKIEKNISGECRNHLQQCLLMTDQ